MDSIKLDITTDASGAGTATHHFINPKVLYAIEWFNGTLSGTVDATFSAVNTPSGVDTTLFTLTDGSADAFYYPRIAAVDGTVGALSAWCEPVIDGSLRVVVAQGGSVNTGGAICYIRDPEGR